jgi:D-alanyl-D-alanine carboxypeptidase/D-alanyl-D-alanine-endopeptidase (penicillin-binding protein 4)
MKAVLTVAALTFSFNAFALDSDIVEKEQKQLEQILKKSGLPESSLGIYIAGGEGSPKVVLSRNPEAKMTPASITKLVTAAATIIEFPPGTKFKTGLYSAAPIEKGVLNGDLILKGAGDPSFVSESMWFLVNAFTRTTVKKVEGDLIVDDELFDKVRFDSSRTKARVDRAYDAPTGAMSFNWNSVNVFVRPGRKPGEPAQVTVDPENQYIRSKVQVTTTAAGSKTSISVDRDGDPKNSGDLVIVSGKIALDSPEVVIFKNITQPDLWAGHNLKSFLSQRGIEVKGTVRAGTTPAKAVLLAESESKPIQDILADMNKFSNNYVAEMLTKNIAAVRNPPGTIEKGMKALNDYMRSLGVPASQFELTNPSGLTRDNKMSALAVWKVLQHMKDQFGYQAEFVTSLPIAGIDGTLKRRMKASPAERWVRAKTGYLDGVVSLAGYAGRRDGTVLPFVLIYNGSADESKVRAVFDQVVTALVE